MHANIKVGQHEDEYVRGQGVFTGSVGTERDSGKCKMAAQSYRR